MLFMLLSQSAFAWPVSRTTKPLRPAGVAASIERPTPDAPYAWTGQSGKASYYGPSFDGHQSASGARFDQTALTAAHAWLPFGTRIKVTLAGSDRSVVVTITDRMPPGRRILDLSVGAARRLGILQCGVAEVSLVPA